MKKETKKKLIWTAIGLGAAGIVGFVLFNKFQKELNEVFESLDFDFDEPADEVQHEARV